MGTSMNGSVQQQRLQFAIALHGVHQRPHDAADPAGHHGERQGEDELVSMAGRGNHLRAAKALSTMARLCISPVSRHSGNAASAPGGGRALCRPVGGRAGLAQQKVVFGVLRHPRSGARVPSRRSG